MWACCSWQLITNSSPDFQRGLDMISALNSPVTTMTTVSAKILQSCFRQHCHIPRPSWNQLRVRSHFLGSLLSSVGSHPLLVTQQFTKCPLWFWGLNLPVLIAKICVFSESEVDFCQRESSIFQNVFKGYWLVEDSKKEIRQPGLSWHSKKRKSAIDWRYVHLVVMR